jgi:class 3 adenylate cyclase
MPQSETVTIVFTSLASATERLQDSPDEAADRLFRNQHRLMTDAIESCGGREMEWLGDGVLASFKSTADAVDSAVKMQQTSRSGDGGFSLRVGLHIGEVLHRDEGYFGTPIVVARRLCDQAEEGQILCSQTVADILSSRASFEFRDLGKQKLKGLNAPISICEVVYENADPMALLNRTPFVGRSRQMQWLTTKLDELLKGRGGMVMLRGEAGIGKTPHPRGIQRRGGFCRRRRAAGGLLRR